MLFTVSGLYTEIAIKTTYPRPEYVNTHCTSCNSGIRDGLCSLSVFAHTLSQSIPVEFPGRSNREGAESFFLNACHLPTWVGSLPGIVLRNGVAVLASNAAIEHTVGTESDLESPSVSAKVIGAERHPIDLGYLETALTMSPRSAAWSEGEGAIENRTVCDFGSSLPNLASCRRSCVVLRETYVLQNMGEQNHARRTGRADQLRERSLQRYSRPPCPKHVHCPFWPAHSSRWTRRE